MPEGTQSPPPERQTGKQLHDPPAKGSGIDEVGNKGDKMKSELEVCCTAHDVNYSLHCEKHTNSFSLSQLQNLSSNPKGPMDDHLEAKFSKEPGNPVGAHIQK